MRGSEDGLIRYRKTNRDSELAGQAITEVQIPNSGHYPNEETPTELNRILLEHLQAAEDLGTS